jgi:hypothetical protein
MPYATDDRHGVWKGDEAGPQAMRDWVRRRKPKPQLCEICRLFPPVALRNISGHNRRDVNDYMYVCMRCAKSLFGEKHGMWKGDNVGYAAVHAWVQRNKPKPTLCEECGQRPPKELANISGKYSRDINDYKYLCRQCHMKFDKIIFYGEDNTAHKLTEFEALEIKIRATNAQITHEETLKDIANDFDVSVGTVANILHGRTWTRFNIREEIECL